MPKESNDWHPPTTKPAQIGPPKEDFDHALYDWATLRATLKSYERNRLIAWLAARIGWERAIEHAKAWHVGTMRNGNTLFWFVDGMRRVRDAKWFDYDEATAKRRNQRHLNAGDYNTPLYGEWLLFRGCTALLVESEKSAFLGSLVLDLLDLPADTVVLATCGDKGLSIEKAKALKQCKRILLLGDLDEAGDAAAYGLWPDALKAAGIGASRFETLEPADLFEGCELSNKFDLGDFAALALEGRLKKSHCKPLQSTIADQVVPEHHLEPIDFSAHWADGSPMPPHIIEFYSDNPPVKTEVFKEIEWLKPWQGAAWLYEDVEFDEPEPVEPWQTWVTPADIPLDANHADITRWIIAQFAAGGMEAVPVEPEPEDAPEPWRALSSDVELVEFVERRFAMLKQEDPKQFDRLKAWTLRHHTRTLPKVRDN